MLELAVAALRRDETPTVVVQHPQDLADFHLASISGPSSLGTAFPLVRHNAHDDLRWLSNAKPPAGRS